MKFLRWGNEGQEKPGALDGQGNIRDLSALVQDIGPETIRKNQLTGLTLADLEGFPVVDGNQRVGSCLASVPNFYCIGLNYIKPGAPVELQGSQQVVIASKATTAIAGPYDDIAMPQDSKKTDWEIELGVVIAKDTWQVPVEKIMDHIFGYCIVNDVNERDYMFERGGQWIKGKSVPGYGPIGPWLVTKDEVSNPDNLNLILKKNDVVMQDANTSAMIHGVARLISHMSYFMKLTAGDLIATGTPPGIGMHQTPPAFLQEGDELELSVSGLGVQRSRVVRMR